MLNLLGTLDRPSSGSVTIDGHAIEKLSDRQLSALRAQTIGFIFQQFHLAPAVPSVENVADGLLYAGRRPRGAPPPGGGGADTGRVGGPHPPQARTSSPAASASGSRSPAR